MPILNFQPRFVEPIRAGTKAQTIRATRKIPIKAGDRLYLYCGLRHPGAFRILPQPTECTKALPIEIRIGMKAMMIAIDGAPLGADEQETLALADGFRPIGNLPARYAFELFWEDHHGKPERDGYSYERYTRVDFEGQIIHWRAPNASH
jgi:hypothetical protein